MPGAHHGLLLKKIIPYGFFVLVLTFPFCAYGIALLTDTIDPCLVFKELLKKFKDGLVDPDHRHEHAVRMFSRRL
jgi:hypothetical protein